MPVLGKTFEGSGAAVVIGHVISIEDMHFSMVIIFFPGEFVIKQWHTDRMHVLLMCII